MLRATYHGVVTYPPRSEDAESEWTQPPFEPMQDPANAGSHSVAIPGQSTSSYLVPADRHGPPSVLESTINVVNGVLWPLLIGLVFFGVGSWWLNIFVAIVASSLLGGIATELKRRRKYLPPAEGDLR